MQYSHAQILTNNSKTNKGSQLLTESDTAARGSSRRSKSSHGLKP